jgi:hypothetical protein
MFSSGRNGGGNNPPGKKPGMFDQDEESITKARLAKLGRRNPAPPPPKPAPAPAAQGVAAGTPAPKLPPKPMGPAPKVKVNSRGMVMIQNAQQMTTPVQKKLQRSNFERRASFERLSGGMPPVHPEDDEPSVTAPSVRYDGNTPATELTSKDLWKALFAPLQSKENRRSKDVYLNVINQFAVGANPRYEPEAPDKPRAHIFVWDVSRAMGAEVPHFLGIKEQTLAQTVDWVRMEGPMKGWRKLPAGEALQMALLGYPVVAIPKDPKSKAIAIVRPAPRGQDGQPRFASAGKKRGNDLGLFEALGAFAAEYYTHA